MQTQCCDKDLGRSYEEIKTFASVKEYRKSASHKSSGVEDIDGVVMFLRCSLDFWDF